MYFILGASALEGVGDEGKGGHGHGQRTAGDKAKVTLRYRGREMAHLDIGIEVLNRIKEDLADIAVCESFPSRVEGRQMIMIIGPAKKKQA